MNPKQLDELLDLISKEEYLENEEKIQKALERSKEEREQRQQEKSQSEAAKASSDVEKADDEKHILDAEKTPTFGSTVSHSTCIQLYHVTINISPFSLHYFGRTVNTYRKRLVIWK